MPAAPTITEFKARFPGKFDAVTDDQITYALGRAARMVDDTWADDDFAEGQMLYAAAFLTSQGLGVATQADTAALAGLSAFRSGAMSVEFKAPVSATSSTDPALATAYGRQFVALRYANRGGPRITGPGASCAL